MYLKCECCDQISVDCWVGIFCRNSQGHIYSITQCLCLFSWFFTQSCMWIIQIQLCSQRKGLIFIFYRFQWKLNQKRDEIFSRFSVYSRQVLECFISLFLSIWCAWFIPILEANWLYNLITVLYYCMYIPVDFLLFFSWLVYEHPELRWLNEKSFLIKKNRMKKVGRSSTRGFSDPRNTAAGAESFWWAPALALAPALVCSYYSTV